MEQKEKTGESELSRNQIERYIALGVHHFLDLRAETYAAKAPPLPPRPEHRLAGSLLPLLVEERLALDELRRLARVALADGYDALASEALKQADWHRAEATRRWQWLVDPRALTKQTVYKALMQPQLRGVKLREAICFVLAYPKFCRGMTLVIAGETCVSESRDGGVRAHLALIDILGRLIIGHCFPEDRGESIAPILAVEPLPAEQAAVESQTAT